MTLTNLRQRLDLALTYAEDGALHTAAEKIRETADLLEQAAATKDRLIDAALNEELSD